MNVVPTVRADEIPQAVKVKANYQSALEKSILQLENANTRGDAVQSFADLYEIAGSKTLLVRTKYKYVSLRHIFYHIISMKFLILSAIMK